jgi:serine protease AprX
MVPAHKFQTKVGETLILPVPVRMQSDPEYTGKGVTICFIDSGFVAHPDLMEPAPRISKILDVTSPANNGDYFAHHHPESWHGTMTSVICAGNGYLSHGAYRGIASSAKVVLIKVHDGKGISGMHIAAAIRWATAHRDAYNIRIINLSVTDDEPTPFRDSIVDAAAEEAFKAGIVLVAAVGNEPGASVKPPANSPHVIAVGGVDDHNTLGMGNESIYHSTFGWTADNFLKPEVIAPSIWLAAPILPGTLEHRQAKALFSILRTRESEIRGVLAATYAEAGLDRRLVLERDTAAIRAAVVDTIWQKRYVSEHYMHSDGTSFAAPIVCSVVAQMLEANPSLGPAEVRNLLVTTARRLRDVPAERQGFGVVDASEALKRAKQEQHSYAPDIVQYPEINQLRQTIRFVFHNHSASSVTLAGSFNGWSPGVNPLMRRGDGLWETELSMPAKGIYQYKIVVDGRDWVEDPSNLRKIPDGFGGFNSVFVIE